jgi:hypothetical protein
LRSRPIRGDPSKIAPEQFIHTAELVAQVEMGAPFAYRVAQSLKSLSKRQHHQQGNGGSDEHLDQGQTKPIFRTTGFVLEMEFAFFHRVICHDVGCIAFQRRPIICFAPFSLGTPGEKGWG